MLHGRSVVAVNYPPCKVEGCWNDSLMWGLCYGHAHEKNGRDAAVALAWVLIGLPAVGCLVLIGLMIAR